MVRIKHRYLLVNILYPESDNSTSVAKSKSAAQLPYTVQFHRPTTDRMDAKSLLQMIRHAVSELFGDYGSGMTSASLQVKYFSPATSTAIVRVSRDHYRLVWAALTFSTQLPKPVFQQPCVFQVVKVSGTIRKAEEAAIRRAQLSIRRAQRESSSITKGLMPGLSSAKDGNVDDDLDAGFANGIEDLDDDEDEDDSG